MLIPDKLALNKYRMDEWVWPIKNKNKIHRFILMRKQQYRPTKKKKKKPEQQNLDSHWQIITHLQRFWEQRKTS